MTKLQDTNVLNRGRDSGINLIFVLAGRTGVVTGGRQEVMEMAEWKRNTIVKAKGRIPKPGQRILRLSSRKIKFLSPAQKQRIIISVP